MKKEEKIIVTIVVVIFISLIINTVMYQLKFLDDIVFFEHHIELDSTRKGNEITLYYITNTNDNRTVQYLDFNQKDMMYIDYGNDWLMPTYKNEELFPFYKVVTLYLRFDQTYELDDLLILENPTVYFNDGSSIVCDIGKVYMSPSSGDDISNFIMSSSSNDGSASEVMRVKEPVDLLGIETALSDYLKDDLLLSIDFTYPKENNLLNSSQSEDVYDYKQFKNLIFPIPVKDILAVNGKLISSDNVILSPILKLNVKNQSGEDFIIDVQNVKSEIYFTNKIIKQVIESRGQ